jgi:hypothetical protein
MKLIYINGRAGVCDGYYDGTTSERACKPSYVPTLVEQKPGVDMNAARLNTRDRPRSPITAVIRQE